MQSQIKKFQESILMLEGVEPNKYVEYLVNEGQAFKPPKDLSQVVKPYKGLRDSMLQKSCFRNALLASLVTSDLEYYQGYYITAGIPIPLEHAWNIKDGVVIDFTAEKFGIEVVEYFGVKLENDFLEEYQQTEQHWTALQQFIFDKYQK